MERNKTLVLFDFDGTITRKDSFLDFILFSNSFIQLALHSLYVSVIFILHRLRVLPSDQAKQKIFSSLYKNRLEAELIRKGTLYCEQRLNRIIRSDARQALNSHQENGHRICIVTASAKYWLKPWCDKHHYELICTEYEAINGRFTGLYKGNNCRGEEKVKKIKLAYNLDDFQEVIGYGDTKDDYPMLFLGTKAFYRRFT